MDGFWTVQFTGVEGWGAGIIVLIRGELFGGDTGYMYTGTYSQQGDNLRGRVHVKAHTPGSPNVMGRSEFDLDISGVVRNSTGTLQGVIPGTSLKITGTLTKQGELPK